MLDEQFSAQNGAANPGISLVVAPPGIAATPEPSKWMQREAAKKQGWKIQVFDNMSILQRMVLCSSEICGTAILVFLGCAGCINFGEEPPLLQVALSFGLAVMVAVQCFGHVSGAHINPLVTVAAATLGNIALIQVPIYFVGQMLGGLVGFGLLMLATPYERRNDGVCSPQITEGVTPLQGLLVEFLLCLVLTLVCCGVWDPRNKTKDDSVPIRFGLTISGLALAGGHYTGANMNPARSFAPALLNADWEYHWVYWLGPLGAGFLGALFYRFLFGRDPAEYEEGNGVAE